MKQIAVNDENVLRKMFYVETNGAQVECLKVCQINANDMLLERSREKLLFGRLGAQKLHMSNERTHENVKIKF